MSPLIKYSLGVSLFLFSYIATSQTTTNGEVVDTEKETELKEVIIHAHQLPKKRKESTTSVAVVTSKEIERQDNTNIAPILNRVPGVFMQSGALNTNRITIRGVGSRNAYGTSKIRAYYKDIPLTSGSGETTIEDFELGAISSIEIVKGGTSIYGAGLGGSIQLNPKKSSLNSSQVSSELTSGSYGLFKSIVNASHGTKKNSLNVVYSNTNSDGYRDNNNYNRQTFTLSTDHFVNEKDVLSFLVSYVDLKAFIPSSINEEDYINSPTSASFTWAAAKGHEDAIRGISGLSWKHQYTENVEQVTSVFVSFKDAYEPRPFNVLEEETVALGLRTRLLGKTQLFAKNLHWVVGVEGFKDNYTAKTFENVYKDYPPGHGSVAGDLLSDFTQYRNYINVFFETNYSISAKTLISLGLNFNSTSYELDDNYPVSELNPDQSGTYHYDPILSPKFGINHELTKKINLYTNVSHGFSPLTIEETLLADGQINTDLKPETGWNYEIGTRGTAFKDRLQFNASIFRLAISNYLVAKRISEDQYIGINAGSTEHDGVEISLSYQIVHSDKFNLSSFASYTGNHFTFKEFIDEDQDFSGNDLTGVPSEVVNFGLDFSSELGLFGNLNFQHVGSMPMTDSNSLYSENYQLTNLKVGYKTNLLKKLELMLFLGVNNVFNEKYASQILINAPSFGGRAPRYYYPGNPSNYYSGLTINYRF